MIGRDHILHTCY